MRIDPVRCLHLLNLLGVEDVTLVYLEQLASKGDLLKYVSERAAPRLGNFHSNSFLPLLADPSPIFSSFSLPPTIWDFEVYLPDHGPETVLRLLKKRCSWWSRSIQEAFRSCVIPSGGERRLVSLVHFNRPFRNALEVRLAHQQWDLNPASPLSLLAYAASTHPADDFPITTFFGLPEDLHHCAPILRVRKSGLHSDGLQMDIQKMDQPWIENWRFLAERA